MFTFMNLDELSMVEGLRMMIMRESKALLFTRLLSCCDSGDVFASPQSSTITR